MKSSMIDNCRMTRFPKPDIIPGQLVMVDEVGTAGHRFGKILTATNSNKARLFGQEGHGSALQTTIDQVVMAAATTMRLQTIVFKEVSPDKLDSYLVTENDKAVTLKLAASFEAPFGDPSFETEPDTASEDFSIFNRSWNAPYLFWFKGGTDPELCSAAKKNNKINTIPSNHLAKFYPVIHPTQITGLQLMITAAATWLQKA